MDETPDDPRLPHGPDDPSEAGTPWGPAQSRPPTGPADANRGPGAGGGEPLPRPHDHELPPLDDDVIPLDGRQRTLGGWRLAVAGVAVLALVGGGAAFALGSGGDDGDDATDGVASIDGSDGASEGEEASGSGNGGRTPDPEFQDAMLEYAECMRDNGVDMPDPEFEDGGSDIMRGNAAGSSGDESVLLGPGNAEWEAAQETCDPIIEDVGPMGDPPSPEEQAEMQDQLVAMAECMRERGYDMPDPEMSSDGGISIAVGGGSSGDGDGPSNMDGETFNEDQQECHEEAGLENGPLGGPPPEEDS